MNFSFVVIGLLVFLGTVSCVTIECEFDWNKEIYTIPSTKYYYCELKNPEVISRDPDDDVSYELAPPKINGETGDPLVDVQMVHVRYPLQLPFIPQDLFDVFENLEYLLMYSTGIEDIERDDFQNATNLKYLRIHTNNIKELQDHIFELTSNLEYINLSFNQIEMINKDTFTGLSKLQELHLNDNKLMKIHSKTFTPLLPTIKFLNLRHNKCVKEVFKRNLDLNEIETVLFKRKCHKLYQDEMIYRSNAISSYQFSSLVFSVLASITISMF
jgi:hypothetical protein